MQHKFNLRRYTALLIKNISLHIQYMLRQYFLFAPSQSTWCKAPSEIGEDTCGLV